MNYLAHLFLGDDGGGLLVGSLAGDFLHGRVEGLALPAAICEGIRLHRYLDSFSDRHPVTLAARRALPAQRRRVSGILLDLAFDHFLARDWHRYSTEPLEDFAARSYAAVRAHRDILPARLNNVLAHMAAENWLCSYRHATSVARAAEGMAPRLSRPALLRGTGGSILAAYAELDAAFQTFFPSARRAAAEWRRPAEKLGHSVANSTE